MTQRTVEDHLREEYFFLSSEIKRVLHQLQTDVACLLLPATLALKHHERIHVEDRAKDCDSAINALRRREEARQFDEDTPRRCSTSSRVRAELQVVPMLTGLFWQIEHDAFYKPRDLLLRGAATKPIIRERTEHVYDAFEELENVLERELQRNADQASGAPHP